MGCLALALMTVGVTCILARRVSEWKPLIAAQVAPIAFAAGLICGGVYWLEWTKWLVAVRETAAMTQTVEGVVNGLKPEPVNGHGPSESIEVAGERFFYSYYNDSPYYNRTVSHGGQVREGNYVRISHLRGQIASIQLCSELPGPRERQ